MMTSTLRERRTGAGEAAFSPLPSAAHLDLLADFRSELQQLSDNQRELLDELRTDGVINLDAEELPRLRQENGELRDRVVQLERQVRAAPAGAVDPGAAAVDDETLQRLNEELEAQRRQIEEDEANLMQQMRTMEMALAKDRAELARHRTELQHQQADFAREIEMASRDPDLRERLASLRPRQQEAPARKPGDQTAAAPPTPAIKNSGIMRRLFG